MTAPVPTTQPPAAGADVEALVPGVWAPGAADAAVSWALSQIEDYCGRRFAKQTSDRVTLTPRGTAVLLADPPVTDVTLVEALVRPLGSLDAPVWTELDPAGYLWTEDGELYDARLVTAWPCWPTLPRSLRVTYDHGFDTWPQAVVDATKALAAAFLVNPTGMSEQRTAETLRRWLTGGATAGGTTSSGAAAGGVSTATALDRLVLVEVS